MFQVVVAAYHGALPHGSPAFRSGLDGNVLIFVSIPLRSIKQERCSQPFLENPELLRTSSQSCRPPVERRFLALEASLMDQPVGIPPC